MLYPNPITAGNTVIVADSSADLPKITKVPFRSAPLKIITKNKEYIDDPALNVAEMVNDLARYKGKSSTSCPNPDEWLTAFGDAEHVFCVTITATLSGSFNAAMSAKKIYEEEHPGRRVFVLNSLSAGPECALLVEKIEELVAAGKTFEEICAETVAYQLKTGLVFILESLKNLANNGRVNPLVAKAAGLLGIRLVGKASDKGDLEPLDKVRGLDKALETLFNRMKELGSQGGKIRIAHCFNEEAAQKLKAMILREFEKAKVEIHKCHGLCSFYAEKGGMLVGFEKA